MTMTYWVHDVDEVRDFDKRIGQRERQTETKTNNDEDDKNHSLQ